MDHHCPWVNNCIGFWNRKYFMLLLFYSLSTLYYYIVTMGHSFVQTIYWHAEAYNGTTQIDLREFAAVFLLDIAYVFALTLAFMLTRFAMFHVRLILKNMTTIETLEHKSTTFESLVSEGEEKVYSTIWDHRRIGTKFLEEIRACGLCRCMEGQGNPRVQA